MSKRRIVKSTLDSQFAAVLRADILSGQMRPGERLTEIILAEESGLSRGTIRAALRLLVAEGLVTQVPYSGWEVARITANDIWELFTLRSALEGLGAYLAASSLTPEKAKRLKAAQTDLKRSCDGRQQSEIAHADFKLHETIIDLAAHGRLRTQYAVIGRQLELVIAMSDALILDPAEVNEQHVPLIEAILARDAETAEQLARSHNEEEGRRLVAHLRAKEAA